MNCKLPPDAFEYYVSLGSERSYEKVAEHYGVSKRAVTNAAGRDNWAGRLAKIEAEARQATDKKLGESIEEMNERHLKVVKVVQGKALETLKSMPLASAMDAVRALDLALKQERVIRGEPGERTATTIEAITRDEMHRWLAMEADEAESDAHEDDEDAG